MMNKFKGFARSPLGPIEGLAAVTPDDAADLSLVTRALNVAVSGTVRVTALDGSVGTIYVAAGAAFPIRVRRVWATGTTAESIQALF